MRWSSSWTISSGGGLSDPRLNSVAGLWPPGHRRELVRGRDHQGGSVGVDVLVDEVDGQAGRELARLVAAADPHPRLGRDLVLPGVRASPRTKGTRGAGRDCLRRPPGRFAAGPAPAAPRRACSERRPVRPRGRSRSRRRRAGLLAPDLLAARDQRDARSNCWIVSSRSVYRISTVTPSPTSLRSRRRKTTNAISPR